MRFLVAVGVILAGLDGVAGATVTSSGVPYTDANAVGYLGLCNQSGQQVTSGSINTTPFAWRAISSEPAPPPYNNGEGTATLLAFQPLNGLPVGDWSGMELTSSSYYTNPANPMAAATDRDQSLADFIKAYPPEWRGFLQLRIYLGAANQQPYSQKYPTLNIKVTGKTWKAVGGGPVNCASGSAESLEGLVPSTTTSSSPRAKKKSGGGAAVGSAAPSTAKTGKKDTKSGKDGK